jgi:F-type H+-transporting ATPase subunit b
MHNQLKTRIGFVALTVALLLVAAPAALAAEEAGGSPLDKLGINLGFMIAQLFNFGVIFILGTIFMWRPLVNLLDARSAKIQKGLEDAAAAANARLNAEAEAEEIKARARAEVQKTIEEARARGDEVAASIEQEAQAEAARLREQARQAAIEERNQQLAGMRSQVGAISVALAQRLIGETMDANRQQALVNDFFAKVPAEARSMTGAVEVISAMPLSEAEQARVRQEIGAADVAFVVDPGILGGLVVRSADRVVDGSVRSSLGSLAERMR